MKRKGDNTAILGIGLTAVVFIALGVGLWFAIGGTLPNLTGEPTFNASTRETVANSLKAMEATLGDKDKQRLQAAVMKEVMGPAIGAAMMGDKKPDFTTPLKVYHGLTARQIIAKAGIE